MLHKATGFLSIILLFSKIHIYILLSEIYVKFSAAKLGELILWSNMSKRQICIGWHFHLFFSPHKQCVSVMYVCMFLHFTIQCVFPQMKSYFLTLPCLISLQKKNSPHSALKSIKGTHFSFFLLSNPSSPTEKWKEHDASLCGEKMRGDKSCRVFLAAKYSLGARRRKGWTLYPWINLAAKSMRHYCKYLAVTS